MQIASPPDLLTPQAAAEIIKVEPLTLAAWRHHGRYALPYRKVGRLIRYDRREVEQWLAARTATSTTTAMGLASV